ncbi:hypothetical protein V8E55_003335 [Tylopilus felleus]
MSEIVPAFPTIHYPFPTPLKPVQVPLGCYPIEVVQFWRGEVVRGYHFPLHWAIIVRTSAERGNTHEIIGDMNTFATLDRFNTSLHTRDDWRGSHVVGFVSPARLDQLLNRIALVEVVRGRWAWNCQNWVHEALHGLNYPGLYTDVNMTFAALQTQMACLLEAWEIGDI